jgi:hypothetical protein
VAALDAYNAVFPKETRDSATIVVDHLHVVPERFHYVATDGVRHGTTTALAAAQLQFEVSVDVREVARGVPSSIEPS